MGGDGFSVVAAELRYLIDANRHGVDRVFAFSRQVAFKEGNLGVDAIKDSAVAGG